MLMPDGRIIKPEIRDAERLQGFPADWTAPAASVARASARWSLVGSAVSVPVARWIGGRLSWPGVYDRTRDRPFADGRTLPRAARFDGRRRHSVAIGPDPIAHRPPHLHSFLEHDGGLLSERATAGFLGRTAVAKLRFAPGFIAAVQAHLRFVADDQMLEKRVA
jgi:DNA (cytosine-5)-methyltransferase 1